MPLQAPRVHRNPAIYQSTWVTLKRPYHPNSNQLHSCRLAGKCICKKKKKTWEKYSFLGSLSYKIRLWLAESRAHRHGTRWLWFMGALKRKKSIYILKVLFCYDQSKHPPWVCDDRGRLCWQELFLFSSPIVSITSNVQIQI